MPVSRLISACQLPYQCLSATDQSLLSHVISACQQRNPRLLSLVISACLAASSVSAPQRDQCLLNHLICASQSRDKRLLSCVISACLAL